MPLNVFLMPQLANAMPQFNFHVITGGAKDLAKRLIDGKLDIAFLPEQFCPAHLDSDLLMEEELLLSVPPKSPLASSEFIAKDDLVKTHLLLPKDFLGLSQWYEEAVEEAGVPADSIERLPIKEYLEAMDTTQRVHFTTSMMAVFTGAGNTRPSIPVKSSATPRSIDLAYDRASEQAKLIRDYILENRKTLVSNHSYLPYLMYQGASSNLSMQLNY